MYRIWRSSVPFSFGHAHSVSQTGSPYLRSSHHGRDACPGGGEDGGRTDMQQHWYCLQKPDDGKGGLAGHMHGRHLSLRMHAYARHECTQVHSSEVAHRLCTSLRNHCRYCAEQVYMWVAMKSTRQPVQLPKNWSHLQQYSKA